MHMVVIGMGYVGIPCAALMRSPIVVGGRGCLNEGDCARAGVSRHGLGRRIQRR
jgi:hypothetical protein